MAHDPVLAVAVRAPAAASRDHRHGARPRAALTAKQRSHANPASKPKCDHRNPATAFPDHAIVGKESGDIVSRIDAGTGRRAFRWIVDPLGSAVNFAHGYPHFAVSLLAHPAAMSRTRSC
jgi:hypothetical protein